MTSTNGDFILTDEVDARHPDGLPKTDPIVGHVLGFEYGTRGHVVHVPNLQIVFLASCGNEIGLERALLDTMDVAAHFVLLLPIKVT